MLFTPSELSACHVNAISHYGRIIFQPKDDHLHGKQSPKESDAATYLSEHLEMCMEQIIITVRSWLHT